MHGLLDPGFFIRKPVGKKKHVSHFCHLLFLALISGQVCRLPPPFCENAVVFWDFSESLVFSGQCSWLVWFKLMPISITDQWFWPEMTTCEGGYHVVE